MYPVCKDKEKEAREKERERENIMYFSEAINYFKCLQSEKKDFYIRIWWKRTCVLLTFLEVTAVVRGKPYAFLLYWIVCNLYLGDLQRINAASISLGLGESGLMFSQTVRLSLVERKEEKLNTVGKRCWRLLSQCLCTPATGFDSVAFRNSWALSQFDKRLRSLFLEMKSLGVLTALPALRVIGLGCKLVLSNGGPFTVGTVLRCFLANDHFWVFSRLLILIVFLWVRDCICEWAAYVFIHWSNKGMWILLNPLFFEELLFSLPFFSSPVYAILAPVCCMVTFLNSCEGCWCCGKGLLGCYNEAPDLCFYVSDLRWNIFMFQGKC